MKILVFADVHANIYALMCMQAMAQELGVEQFWCLGDIVGRGPYPVEALDFVGEIVTESMWVAGNHEAHVFDLITSGERGRYNDAEHKTLDHHRVLIDEKGKYALWQERVHEIGFNARWQQYDDFIYGISHATYDTAQYKFKYIYPWTGFRSIYKWVLEPVRQYINSEQMRNLLLFYGHTHLPHLFHADAAEPAISSQFDWTYTNCHSAIQYHKPIDIQPGVTLVNPGSVGLPRNGYGSFVVLDTTAQQLTYYPIMLGRKCLLRIERVMRNFHYDPSMIKKFTDPGLSVEKQIAHHEIFKEMVNRDENIAVKACNPC